MKRQICVVGGGPAGVAVSTMLKRYSIDVVLFEYREIGGLLNNAWRVENFPMLSPSSGETLCRKLKEHLSSHSVNVINERVVSVRNNKVITDRSEYSADRVIVATGTQPKRLPDFEVSSNVVYEFRDLPTDVKVIAIYGAGDMAFDSAIKARSQSMRVLQFCRRKYVRAIPALVNEARTSGVEFRSEEPVYHVESDGSKLVIKTSSSSYLVDALLICVGRDAYLPELDNRRYEIIGDARGEPFRQASIAVGDGVRTAMRIAAEW